MTSLWKNENTHTLQNKDCLDFLRSLDDDSADMILVDPPYYKIVKDEWDNQWIDEDAYLEWCRDWTTECVRILKPNRMMVVWGTLKTDTFLRYKLNVLNETVMNPQTEIIWHYNWGGRTKSNFARKSELAWCYSKGDSFLFNDKSIRVERKVKKNLRTGEEYQEGTIPTNVWNFQNHTTSKEHCGWHPTTKNIDCLERMILAYTNENDVVLDCFSGSGSTIIACERSNRKFIGCEINEVYYQKSLERFEKLKNA